MSHDILQQSLPSCGARRPPWNTLCLPPQDWIQPQAHRHQVKHKSCTTCVQVPNPPGTWHWKTPSTVTGVDSANRGKIKCHVRGRGEGTVPSGHRSFSFCDQRTLQLCSGPTAVAWHSWPWVLRGRPQWCKTWASREKGEGTGAGTWSTPLEGPPGKALTWALPKPATIPHWRCRLASVHSGGRPRLAET